MQIQIFERFKENETGRTEIRTYEISDSATRILVDKTNIAGEVWGYDENNKPYGSVLIDVDKNAILLG